MGPEEECALGGKLYSVIATACCKRRVAGGRISARKRREPIERARGAQCLLGDRRPARASRQSPEAGLRGASAARAHARTCGTGGGFSEQDSDARRHGRR